MQQTTQIIKCLLSSEIFRTNENIFVNLMEIKNESALHSHDFTEISFVHSGTGKHILGDCVYDVKKGDCFIVSRHIQHQYVSDNPHKPLKILSVIFQLSFLNHAYTGTEDFSLIVNSFTSNFLFATNNFTKLYFHDDDKAIENLMISIYSEYLNRQANYLEFIQSCLMQLFIKIFRKVNGTANFTRIDQRCKLAISYILENLKKDISVAEVAEFLHFSTDYFTKFFKTQIGITPSKFITQVKMEKAASLLQDSQMSIFDIAINVGYMDLRTFQTAFKKFYNVSPSTFRKNQGSTF